MDFPDSSSRAPAVSRKSEGALSKGGSVSQALPATDGKVTPQPANDLDLSVAHSTALPDLRRIAINPDFWYPVAESRSLRKGTTRAAVFAGERIALYRGRSGTVYAIEDRCAHRQVPLSMGVVEGEALRCCYHAWAYRGSGRISQIPYLPNGTVRPPRGVRAYPVREAYGLVFVFPGDARKAAATPPRTRRCGSPASCGAITRSCTRTSST
jgi:phenylpropionate dioxygenase-like ring-hydroxylating dioxygenase large terminal subunit